jgi:hypothetical protein
MGTMLTTEEGLVVDMENKSTISTKNDPIQVNKLANSKNDETLNDSEDMKREK